MKHLTQALKTKTGAVQTAAVKRIFHLAVRDLPDETLAELNLQLDYTPRGMNPAYYVSVAEAAITKLVEAQAVHKLYGISQEPVQIKSVVETVLLGMGVLAKHDAKQSKPLLYPHAVAQN